MQLTRVLCFLAFASALGCHRDQMRSMRLEKAAPATLPSGHPPLPATPAEGPLPQPENDRALRWTLPKGWTAEMATGLRYATLHPPVAGKLEVSVVTLAGPAGGELANLNRWRAQLGLPSLAAAALVSERKVVRSQAGPVAVFEISNAGNRMVVGLLTTGNDSTWFLKLVGEDAPVRQAQPAFLQLLGTLSLD